MIENENCSRSADKKFYEQVAWVSSFRWFLKCAGLSWSVDLAEKAWCLATLNFYNSATHSSVQAKCLLHPCGKHTCDWKTAVFQLEKHLDNAGSSLLYSFAWVKQVVEVAGFPQKKIPFYPLLGIDWINVTANLKKPSISLKHLQKNIRFPTGEADLDASLDLGQ